MKSKDEGRGMKDEDEKFEMREKQIVLLLLPPNAVGDNAGRTQAAS